MQNPCDPIVGYRPRIAHLPDDAGKPLGTDAALFLSQALWRTRCRSEGEGWFAFDTVTCERETGLTRRQQDRIRRQLLTAGFLERERRGEAGRLFLRLTERFHAAIAEGEDTDTQNGATEFQLHQNGVSSAQNGATEPDRVSTKDTKKTTESTPLIPPTGERKNPSALLEVAARELFAAFHRIRYRNEQVPQRDWQHCRAAMIGLVEDGIQPEQMEAATQRALAEWTSSAMVTPRAVARNILTLLSVMSVPSGPAWSAARHGPFRGGGLAASAAEIAERWSRKGGSTLCSL
jgi:hypothetical protein